MEAARVEPAAAAQSSSAPRSLVIIASGTGGVAALSEIIPRLPVDFPAPILIVQQMRRGFTRILARELRDISELDVHEGADGEVLKKGVALLAPGGKIVRIAMDPQVKCFLRVEPPESPDDLRNRANIAMSSAAQILGAGVIGVVLTGVGDDGRSGLKSIIDRGGRTLAQDEMSSIAFDMPKAAINAGVAEEVLPLWNIADRLIDLIGEVHGSFLPEAAG